MRKRIARDQKGLFADAIFDPANLKLRARSLSLDEIERPKTEVRGSAAFRNSVEQYGGIFEPVVVQWDERKGKFLVVEGGRRYFAVSDLVAEEKLPAKTKLPASEIVGLPLDLPPKVVRACVSLLLNHLRGDNVVADAANVQVLMSAGATEGDLKKFAGLDEQTIKQLVKVTRLIGPLKKAMNEGRISQTVVRSVAKLREPQQERLAEILAAKIGQAEGEEAKRAVRLTHEDVRAVKEIASASAVQQLPGDLFEGVADLTPDESSPYRYHFEQVRRLEAGLPQKTPREIRQRFKDLLDVLRFEPTPVKA